MTQVMRKAAFIMLAILVAEGIPMVLMFAWSRPGLLARLTTTQPSEWPAWVAAAAVAVGYSLYSMRSLKLIAEQFFTLHALKLLAVPFAVISGTMEEVWFRRQLMDWLQGLGATWMLQVLASALLFGLVHGVWGAFARKWRVALHSMLATFGLGACLAAVYLLAHRHVAPCVVSHFAINLALEPWLLVAAISAGIQERTDVLIRKKQPKNVYPRVRRRVQPGSTGVPK